jgi:putative aldouronate transport system substrate-binding protein
MAEKKLSRRDFLGAGAVAAAGAAAAACQPKTVIVEKEKIVKETVEVEKVVTQVVTQVVKETVKETVVVAGTPKVVEKEVTKVVEKVVEVEKEAAFQTAEEILTPLGLMPGSPDHPKGWKTILPDLPAGMPRDPPVVINAFTRTDASTRFEGGDDIYDNISLRWRKAIFGIDFQIPWTYVQGEEREQKMNLAIASDDIPDFMNSMSLSIYQDLLDADMLADITDLYDTYASPRWLKEPHSYGNGAMWAFAEVDGRKMAFPTIAQAGQDEQILFIRTDWLDKVGMEPPTTLEEMDAVAEAFVTNDLGAGPPGTTQGVMASGNLQSWYGGLGPVFGGFGVLPQWYGSVSTFVDDGTGTILWQGIDPRMKDALAFVRSWYERGIIAGDFFTKGFQENRADAEGNRVGMSYTHAWGGTMAIAVGSMKNDPEARWTFIDVPAGPAGKGKNYYHPLRDAVMPCRKGFEHIDALIQAGNFEAEIALSPELRWHGFEGHNYKWDGDKVVTETGGTHGYGMINTRGGTTHSATSNMNNIKWKLDYKDKVPREKWDAWMELQLDDPSGVQIMQMEGWLFLAEHSLPDTIKNVWKELPTELQKEKWGNLTTLTNETFFGIITGELPLDAFDGFIPKWKEQGGDAILQEIQEWYDVKGKYIQPG